MGDFRSDAGPPKLTTMCDCQTIDSELRPLVTVRQVCREFGGTVPSTCLIDEAGGLSQDC
jgi:hypothetical protein